jgi:hypothetical protein
MATGYQQFFLWQPTSLENRVHCLTILKISDYVQTESWPKTLKQHDHVQAAKQRNNMNDNNLQEWNGESEHMG